MKVAVSPQFSRQFKSLPTKLKEEAVERIELLKEKSNHQMLRVHKLKGQLLGRYSFSVTYHYRIIFMYTDNTHTEAILLAIGDHAVYE